MQIKSLDIGHFRNIELAHVELSPGFNVIYGANAQGKSNFLEAVYTLAFLKGFRADKVANLIQFGERAAQLGACVDNDGAQTRLSLELNPNARRIFMDGVPCSKVGDYLGLLRAILFVPADVGILQSAPAQRRTMLDRMVFNLHPAYLLDLERYQKLYRQKSAELKSVSPNSDLLDVFNTQMTETGECLIRARCEYLTRISPYITACFREIFDEATECRILYKSSTCSQDMEPDSSEGATIENIIESFKKHQAHSRERELATQQVSSGPHRDDWGMRINGESARHYASQGQQRTLCIAMKIAEIQYLRDVAQINPIFLLDDVSSELDPMRHKKLYQYLDRLTGQVLLTTTSREHVHLENVGRLFKMESGGIVDES